MVLRACARSLPHRAVGLHLLAVTTLLALTGSALDDPHVAVLVLRGVAVLLAMALALGVDEPSALLLDATPTGLAQRLAGRLALLAAALAPFWVLALATVAAQGADVPVAALTLELAALSALALAVGLTLRRWWQLAEPAALVAPVLFGALLAAYRLPRRLALLEVQLWGPPWVAAHLRWTALLVAALSLLLVAAQDPATARVRAPRMRR